ncbi:MAG: uracil-DNA glycosylase family protein, partial [Candidatus Paceibacterota bacterium]
PSPEELALYAPFLDRQIEIIQPKVISTLGRFSMNYILERYGTPEMIQPISKNHGKKYEVTMGYGPVTVIPLYHPAAAIYSTATKEDLEKDFEILKEFYTPTKTAL